MAYALTTAATTLPAPTGLASFATVIAAAAHLPLVPVIDWATRAAKAITSGTPIGATTVSLIDSRSRRVIHAGCACGPTLKAFETTLYRLATNGRRQQPVIGAARFAEWSDTDSHPFLEAGLPHGTIICATLKLAEDTVLSICHWRGPAPPARSGSRGIQRGFRLCRLDRRASRPGRLVGHRLALPEGDRRAQPDRPGKHRA